MKSRKYAQKKWKKLLRDVDGFIFDVENVVILLRKYTGKTKIAQGNNRKTLKISLSKMSGNHDYEEISVCVNALIV